MERIQTIRSIDSVDWISALPDSILGIILSCLPTNEAVATSILSKRFQFVWRTVHNLNFMHLGHREEQYEGENMKFAEFVNHVLLLNDFSFLDKFYLFWKPRCIFSYVSSWIRTAITKNVQDLFLCVERNAGPDSTPEPIEMLVSAFSCDRLRYLELDGGISFSSEDDIFLPRLENLKLFSFHFESFIGFEKLISGCPMLNLLDMDINIDYMIDYFGEGDQDFAYCISSTSLRRLVIYVERKEKHHYLNFYCSLLLKTPSLEYLTMDGSFKKIHVEKCLTSLIEVDFSIDLLEGDFHDPGLCNPIVEVVRAFDYAKTLTLSGDAMWALNNATISLSTEFKRLEKFVTECYCYHCCLLQDFIQSSNNLEELTIYQEGRTGRHSCHTNWKAPVEVPRCLSNSLKKVVLSGYGGLPDERELILYILKHGSVLEYLKIELDCDLDDSKFELIRL